MQEMQDSRTRQAGRAIHGLCQWVLFPALFYLVAFALLTYPLILGFSSRYFHGAGDGWENVWNLWWVNKAVTQLHQSPWHTHFLRFPHGTTLVGHTLNPFNGFAAVLLFPFMTAIQVYNTIVAFSFVMGGLAAFALAHHFVRSYWPALLAGFVFTFSSFHFATMAGHLQLVALEWLPLCFLYVYRLLTEPRPRHAMLAALMLFLVLLCDYYYFFYSVLAGCLIVIAEVVRQRRLFFMNRACLQSCGVFVALVLLSCGPLLGRIVHYQRHDPLLGSHNAAEFCADLLSPLVPHMHWRFAALTERYWSRLTPVDQGEGDGHLAVALCLAAWALWRRARYPDSRVMLFALVAVVFFALALGPHLHLYRWSIPFRYMPYRALVRLVPPLRMSGVPMRMLVMVSLAVAVLAACGLQTLWEDLGRKRRWLVAVVLAAIVVETCPEPLPGMSPEMPAFVEVLRELPPGGVLDSVSGAIVGQDSRVSYHATYHGHPVALGVVSRVPESVARKDYWIHWCVAHRAYERLRREFQLRYWVTAEAIENPALRELYVQDAVHIYEILADTQESVATSHTRNN